MIIISLTNCPYALRGELTRWFFEVDTNLYVGKHSARIREKIWERITTNIKTGQAIMVYPTNNEQGFDYRVWGSTWQPIDYDGIKLMLRPHPGEIQMDDKTIKRGKSKAERRLETKRFAKNKRNIRSLPDTYIVIDIETTGLSVNTNEIIEIGAIKVIDRVSVDTFQSIIRTKTNIPPEIEELTGITKQIISINGCDINEAIREFKTFVGELPLISHNIGFDMGFLRKAYEECEYSLPTNICIDTLRLSKMLVDDPIDYKLGTLLEYFCIEHIRLHRVIGDCEATQLLFEKLRAIIQGDVESKVIESDENS